MVKIVLETSTAAGGLIYHQPQGKPPAGVGDYVIIDHQAGVCVRKSRDRCFIFRYDRTCQRGHTCVDIVYGRALSHSRINLRDIDFLKVGIIFLIHLIDRANFNDLTQNRNFLHGVGNGRTDIGEQEKKHQKQHCPCPDNPEGYGAVGGTAPKTGNCLIKAF